MPYELPAQMLRFGSELVAKRAEKLDDDGRVGEVLMLGLRLVDKDQVFVEEQASEDEEV